MRLKLGDSSPQVLDQSAQALVRGRVEVDRDPAGDDTIHHQPVAEAGVAGLQDLLAQDAAMGVDQGVGRVVADEAEVVHVIGYPLELGQQRPQPVRAGRRLAAAGGLGGTGEGQGEGHGAVAGDAAGEPGAAGEVGTLEQPLDALVHIAQALLEAGHGLAIGGEAEMAGLDDAGMHGADRDLV